MDPWPVALAGAVLLLVLLLLALKLRGPRNRTDLTGPPRRQGRVFTAAEAERIGELVAGGDRAEALRLIRAAGHEESEALKLVELIERLAAGGDGKALP